MNLTLKDMIIARPAKGGMRGDMAAPGLELQGMGPVCFRIISTELEGPRSASKWPAHLAGV